MLQSAKQYSEKKKNKKNEISKSIVEPDVKKEQQGSNDYVAPFLLPVSIDKPREIERQIECSFFHPDNEKDEYINREYVTTINNRPYRIKIVNGVLKTTIIEVIKKLKSLKWEIINTREVLLK